MQFSLEWHFPALDQVGEVDSVFQHFFIRKVNFLQVNNKLEVSRTSLQVFQELFPFWIDH